MPNKLKLLGVFALVLFLSGISLASAQVNSPTAAAAKDTPVTGRLASEKHGQEDWLVLHAKDAKTYLLLGNLKEELKNKLASLGEKNLVTLSGTQDGSSNVSCEQNYKYVRDERKGTSELKADTKCFRYLRLAVKDIASAVQSDETIPPPQRDIEEERKAIRQTAAQSLTPMIMGEIYGKIAVLNTKSAFKTIEIQNSDTVSPISYVTLVITPDTRIAKKIGKEEPMGLSPEGLKVGQEITATYSKDELKSQALFITITKE